MWITLNDSRTHRDQPVHEVHATLKHLFKEQDIAGCACGENDRNAHEVGREVWPYAIIDPGYRRAEIGSCAALGATGLHADELVAPVLAGLPEDACLHSGIDLLPGLSGPINIVSIGARGYSVTTRDATGHIAHRVHCGNACFSVSHPEVALVRDEQGWNGFASVTWVRRSALRL